MSPIVARDLTKTFGAFTAVDRLNLEVRQGEIFGFLGANGAGKTTALRMLTGLLKPSAGTAEVAGIDVSRHPNRVKQRIGYMSQKFSLYEDLTVRENIRLYGGIYGLKPAEIRVKTEQVLRELELTDHQNTLARALPLGWKQKLAFSTAMLHEPAIVFLDEPTSGVDPLARRQFWELIYAAADRGVTLMVTTHYMEEAEYCARVSIMAEGRIVALDTPGRLKARFGVGTMDEIFRAIRNS
jgi:ABC-2 type transport system ATP-binding protein